MTLNDRIRGETKQFRTQRVLLGEVEGDLSGGSVKATGGSGFQTLADWMAGVERIDTEEQGGFWSNVGAVAPKIARIRDRVFVGDAAVFPATRAPAEVNDNDTWIPDAAAGANWAPRDSQFVVMQDAGGLAVTGMSKASLGESLGLASPPAPIGVAGFIINDSGANKASWAFYADIQHEPTSGNAASYGMEVAAKNKGANSTAGPYGLGFGVYGLWLVGGGDNAYGGSAANPSNAAIIVKKGDDYGWNRGIVFEAGALTGTDGVSGVATAISMARGHRISWEYAGATVGASIRSEVDINGREVSQTFLNNQIYFGGNNTNLFRLINVASAVSHVQITNAATGNPVLIEARSDDGETNIDISLAPKGTGTVRITTLPTSASGLAAGSLWNDSGTVKVVS